MSESKLPSAFIENEFLRLEYLRTTGPRIIGLYAKGVEGNLLAETPDAHWDTPHGEYYLRGGHRLWTAPEDPFYTCPEDGLEVLEERKRVILKSPIDAAGLQKEIAIALDKNRVHLSHRVIWHGDKPAEFAPWAVTQLRLGGMAILPQSKVEGLLPDRNLVFWPYSSVKDERFELHDDMILIHASASRTAFKIGNFNSHGWVACTLGDAVLVKRFTVNASGRYADMGCNAEVYVSDSCIELETLGAMTLLDSDESMTHEESWEVIIGDYPATPESARKISSQLSQS